MSDVRHDISTQAYMAVALFDDEFTSKLKDPFENHEHPDWRGTNVDTLMNLIARAIKDNRMKRKGTNPAPFMEGSDSLIAEHCGREEDYRDSGWRMDCVLTSDDAVHEQHKFSKKYYFDREMDIQCWVALERIGDLAVSMGLSLYKEERGPAENPEGQKVVREYRSESLGVRATAILRLEEWSVTGWLRQFDLDDDKVRNEIDVIWTIEMDGSAPPTPVPDTLKSKRLANKTGKKGPVRTLKL